MFVFEGTLEADILAVFREEVSPLTAMEIWETLDKKHIQVPILYLNKVLMGMVQLEQLDNAGERFEQPAYRPVRIRLSGRGGKKQLALFWQHIKNYPLKGKLQNAN